jgi:hypothetical protein
VGTAGAARGGWEQLGEAGGSWRHLWGSWGQLETSKGELGAVEYIYGGSWGQLDGDIYGGAGGGGWEQLGEAGGSWRHLWGSLAR